jgi:hypothetical protein
MLTGVRFGGIFFGNFDHDRAVRLRPIFELTGRRARVETTEQEGTFEPVRKMKNLKRRVRVGFLIALALVGGVALTTYDATQSAHNRHRQRTTQQERRNTGAWWCTSFVTSFARSA